MSRMRVGLAIQLSLTSWSSETTHGPDYIVYKQCVLPLMALICGTQAWKMTSWNYTSLWKIDGKDATWTQLRWTLVGLEVAGGMFSENEHEVLAGV